MRGAQCDPVSVAFDKGAADLLRRAAAAGGGWASTWLQPPSRGWYTWAAQAGIDLDATDRWGEVRWIRAFKRAVYYQHKWYFYETRGLDLSQRRVSPNRGQALIWQTGERGLRGTAVRIRLARGGSAAERAVQRKPPQRRYTEDPDYRSTLADRDW